MSIVFVSQGSGMAKFCFGVEGGRGGGGHNDGHNHIHKKIT